MLSTLVQPPRGLEDFVDFEEERERRQGSSKGSNIRLRNSELRVVRWLVQARFLSIYTRNLETFT